MAKTNVAKILVRGLLKPSDWTDPKPAVELQNKLNNYFSLPAFPVNSGRSALYIILKAAGIGDGDEVLIQAYTCNAVPNPIIWTGAKPIYADINPDTLNVDINDLSSKVTDKTRAIILQHTFGRPGPIDEVLRLAKEKKLLVIEDCAHSLGATYKGKKLGTYGDAAILSFGREKVISSLAGGAILIKNKSLLRPIEELIGTLTYTPFTNFIKEFNNYFAWRLLIRRIFFTNFGKNLLKSLNNSDLFNVVYSKKELSGEKPEWFPAAYPGTLARVALELLPDLEQANKDRLALARIYERDIKNENFRLLQPHEGVYLRFAIFHKNAKDVIKEGHKRGFWFGDWYSWPIYPRRVNLEKMFYKPGICPNVEMCASETINLPIYPGMNTKETSEVVDFLNSYK